MADMVLGSKPRQTSCGAHVDDNSVARAAVHAVDRDVVVADRLPVQQILRWKLEKLRTAFHRHPVDQCGQSPPRLVECNEFTETFNHAVVEVFDALALG
ncbi:hypothetical protein [Pseudomonas sp. NBRC 111119]|uniref:hypothetical protein n=1 Tax=Pseudomonas sp. NBRC 111119 TaxID=1661034 RepID=UPI0015A55498|nr:hypothetical protein [Pseudomonas sp. NBRC 111119]